jgi:putative transposase
MLNRWPVRSNTPRQAQRQRCPVDWYRDVSFDPEAHDGWPAVLKGKVQEVAAMLIKAIHAQEDRQAAREKAQAVVEKLESMRLANAAQVVRDGVEETLLYMSFPREHWVRTLTNNVLERIMREIRRRTRVVGNSRTANPQ